MNFKKYAAIALGVAGVSSQVSARSFFWGVGGHVGVSLMQSINIEPVDKIEAEANISEDFIKGGINGLKEDLLGKDHKNLLTVPFGGGLVFGFNFGEEGKEKWGIEWNWFFARWVNAIKRDKFKDPNDSSTDGTLIIGYKGFEGGICLKWMFAQFDGGNFFAKLGISFRNGFGDPIVIDNGKSLFENIKNEDEKKEEIETNKKIFPSENVAFRVAFGVDLLDRIVSVSIDAKYWFKNGFSKDALSEQYKKYRKDDLVNSLSKNVKVSRKSGLDITFNVGVNFARWFF